MYEISAEIEASPERVWEVLADLAAWPQWESGILRTEGRLEPGARIRVTSAVSPDRTFPLKVTEFDPPHAMTFEGGMPLGLFKGVRTYRLEPRGADRTRLEMREVYSGPLSGMITRSMPDLQPSFETFAQGLKARTEAMTS